MLTKELKQGARAGPALLARFFPVHELACCRAFFKLRWSAFLGAKGGKNQVRVGGLKGGSFAACA